MSILMVYLPFINIFSCPFTFAFFASRPINTLFWNILKIIYRPFSFIAVKSRNANLHFGTKIKSVAFHWKKLWESEKHLKSVVPRILPAKSECVPKELKSIFLSLSTCFQFMETVKDTSIYMWVILPKRVPIRVC